MIELAANSQPVYAGTFFENGYHSYTRGCSIHTMATESNPKGSGNYLAVSERQCSKEPE